MRSMRWMFVGMTMVLALNGGAVRAADPKPPKPDVGSGRIAWFDITTTDMPKAKEFYGKLFGWTFLSLKGTDLAAEIVADRTSIGTLRVAEGKLSPYDGVVYVQVADMRESCKKAQALGGKIPPGFPFNLTERSGAVAVVIDPAGHPVGMYSHTPLPPPPAAAK